MEFRRLIILVFVGITLIGISEGENATSTTAKTLSSTLTSTSESTSSSTTTSTTTTSSSTTPVPDRPIRAPGCYWTPCQSPLTYNLKCPPDTQEQNENDEMPCPGIFLKYQCCPKDKVTTETPKKPVKGDKVVPEGV